VKTLWPVQEDVLREAAAKCDGRSCALFPEMRLGKIIMSLRKYKGSPGHKLVVGPLSVLPDWQDELDEEGLGHCLLRPPQSNIVKLLEREAGPWFLTNYENYKHVAHLGWHTVILDESTRIKDAKVAWTKLLLRRAPAIPERCVLTGFPNPEGVLNFWTQMAFVCGGRFMGHSTFWTWRLEYFRPSGHKWFPKPGAGQAIREAVEANAVFKSRADAGFKDLKQFTRRFVQLPAEARAAYADAERNWRHDGRRTMHAVVRNTWLFRISGGEPFAPEARHGAKADEVMGLLKGELRNEQVVIWFRFNRELYSFQKKLKAAGITHTCLTGNTPFAQKRARQKAFQAGQRRVILVQIKIRYGINLSAANTAIYYSFTPSGEEFTQSQDRIVHLSKSRNLLLLFVLAENTADVDLYKAVRENKQLTSKAFNENLTRKIREALSRGKKQNGTVPPEAPGRQGGRDHAGAGHRRGPRILP
jgi:hypothetical protein